MHLSNQEVPQWAQHRLCLFSQFALGPVLCEGAELDQAQSASPWEV